MKKMEGVWRKRRSSPKKKVREKMEVERHNLVFKMYSSSKVSRRPLSRLLCKCSMSSSSKVSRRPLSRLLCSMSCL